MCTFECIYYIQECGGHCILHLAFSVFLFCVDMAHMCAFPAGCVVYIDVCMGCEYEYLVAS